MMMVGYERIQDTGWSSPGELSFDHSQALNERIDPLCSIISHYLLKHETVLWVHTKEELDSIQQLMRDFSKDWRLSKHSRTL